MGRSGDLELGADSIAISATVVKDRELQVFHENGCIVRP